MQASLRLDKIIGFNGSSDDLLHCLPGNSSSTLVYPIGGLLVLEQHQNEGQRYLKLHDMPITAISVSPTGKPPTDF